MGNLGLYLVVFALRIAPFAIPAVLLRSLFRLSWQNAFAWVGISVLAYYAYEVVWTYYYFDFARVANECPKFWETGCKIAPSGDFSTTYWLSNFIVGFLFVATSIAVILRGTLFGSATMDGAIKVLTVLFAAFVVSNLMTFDFMHNFLE